MRRLTCFLVMIAVLASCKKNNDKEEVLLRPGRLTGIITPAGACASVTAKNVQTNSSYNGVIDASGNNFYIGDLPPGSYTVSFVAAANYTSPGNRTATVSENTSSDLGTITFQSTLPGISGTLSLTGFPFRVVATRPDRSVYETNSDATTGFFKFTGLMPGRYTVLFTPFNGYKTPPDKIVTIAFRDDLPLTRGHS